MCLLAIHFQVCDAAPLLIAANREEFYNRPSLGPTIEAGPPRVLCGVDARAGGTWLGVNEHGVVAAVTNRFKPRRDLASPQPPSADVIAPAALRSRGLLCRDLLDFDGAAAAAQFAYEQLSTGAYDGANFVCLDAGYGAVIHAGTRLEVVALSPGLHILTAGDLNDAADRRQVLARRLFAEQSWAGPREFVEAARRVCSQGPVEDCSATWASLSETRDRVSERRDHVPDHVPQPGIVLHGDGRGTVSSTILAVARRADESLYHFAAGAPDTTAYQDRSDLLRSIFSGEAQRNRGGDAAHRDFPRHWNG